MHLRIYAFRCKQRWSHSRTLQYAALTVPTVNSYGTQRKILALWCVMSIDLKICAHKYDKIKDTYVYEIHKALLSNITPHWLLIRAVIRLRNYAVQANFSVVKQFFAMLSHLTGRSSDRARRNRSKSTPSSRVCNCCDVVNRSTSETQIVSRPGPINICSRGIASGKNIIICFKVGFGSYMFILLWIRVDKPPATSNAGPLFLNTSTCSREPNDGTVDLLAVALPEYLSSRVVTVSCSNLRGLSPWHW